MGTETLTRSNTVKKSLYEVGDSIVVSLDITDSKVISKVRQDDPKEAFESLKDSGVRKFIFLDISSVGTLSGFEFDFLKDIQIEKRLE